MMLRSSTNYNNCIQIRCIYNYHVMFNFINKIQFCSLRTQSCFLVSALKSSRAAAVETGESQAATALGWRHRPWTSQSNNNSAIISTGGYQPELSRRVWSNYVFPINSQLITVAMYICWIKLKCHCSVFPGGEQNSTRYPPGLQQADKAGCAGCLQIARSGGRSSLWLSWVRDSQMWETSTSQYWRHVVVVTSWRKTVEQWGKIGPGQ